MNNKSINDFLNKIILGDCLQVMKEIPDNSVDMIITSPPYDKIRNYNDTLNWNFEIFKEIANQTQRILKSGGVIVWVVSDQTINGSETGTSFEQALYFKSIGYKLHDTMIYKKNSYPFPPSNRYYQQFEYMFVFSKGKPKTANIQTQKTEWKKSTKEISTTRQKNGNTKKMKYEKGKEERKMDNVWEINTGYMRSTKDKFAYKHPAIFPEELAKRHILTWSNENDIILDPLCGSGTSCKMAKINNRNYIGIEKNKEYYEICLERIM